MPAAASHVFEDHTGEVRLRLSAPSIEELFAEAGRAIAEISCGDRPLPEPEGEPEPVSLRARDREALLVAWLNELVFRAETEHQVFVAFRLLGLTGQELVAEIRGTRLLEARPLVKAATLHDLHVTEGSHGVSATVVLDV